MTDVRRIDFRNCLYSHAQSDISPLTSTRAALLPRGNFAGGCAVLVSRHRPNIWGTMV